VIGAADVDVAELYDGFTMNCLSWSEALDCCGVGRGKGFSDASRTSRSRPPVARSHPRPATVALRTYVWVCGMIPSPVRGLCAAPPASTPGPVMVSSGGLTPSGLLLLRPDYIAAETMQS